MNSSQKYYILEKWPKSSLCVTRRTRNFRGLIFDIMTFYEQKSKSTEICEDLINSRVLRRKFVFLLRNPLKIGKIFAKNTKFEWKKGSKSHLLSQDGSHEPLFVFWSEKWGPNPELTFRQTNYAACCNRSRRPLGLRDTRRYWTVTTIGPALEPQTAVLESTFWCSFQWYHCRVLKVLI